VQRTLMSSLSANARQKHSNKPQNSDITRHRSKRVQLDYFQTTRTKKAKRKTKDDDIDIGTSCKNDLFHNADTEHNNDTKCK